MDNFRRGLHSHAGAGAGATTVIAVVTPRAIIKTLKTGLFFEPVAKNYVLLY
jgi:hypothetical protein